MSKDLLKADKRLCRELIHVGLERECEKFVKELQIVCNRAFSAKEVVQPYSEERGCPVEGSWHKRYVNIYRTVNDFNRHVASRHNGVTGSHELMCVVGLYVDDWLTDDEIARFSEVSRNYIMAYKKQCE